MPSALARRLPPILLLLACALASSAFADAKRETGRATLARCGYATAALSLHGADHQATTMSLKTAGYGAPILRWLLAHHR